MISVHSQMFLTIIKIIIRYNYLDYRNQQMYNTTAECGELEPAAVSQPS